MCRFALYMGPAITLDLLTTRPEHSIVRQSFKSRLMKEPLNGDGFGLAWYVPEISPEPAQFRSIQPAWNNVNLLHLARVSQSPVILAHVRAASPGLGVSESNCHPFAAGPYAFMHNGSIANFRQLKRRFQERLSDEAFLCIHGTTDSEHLFALFYDEVRSLRDGQTVSVEDMAAALQQTIRTARELTRDAGVRSTLNLAVTDGRTAVASRYVTDDSEGLSLYVRTGAEYRCSGDLCQMRDDDGSPTTAIVASEPLTLEPGWREVPQNHMVLIYPDRHAELKAIT